MKQNPIGPKEPGIVKGHHKWVLLVFVLVAALACVLFYISRLQSVVKGEARDLFYSANAYLVECAKGTVDFNFDSQDMEKYYITNSKTLSPYSETPIKCKFTAVISKELKPVYVESTLQKNFFNIFELTVITSYPKGSASKDGLYIQKVIKPENNTNSREDGVYNENQPTES